MPFVVFSEPDLAVGSLTGLIKRKKGKTKTIELRAELCGLAVFALGLGGGQVLVRPQGALGKSFSSVVPQFSHP